MSEAFDGEFNNGNGEYGACMGTVWRVIFFMEILFKISLEIILVLHGQFLRLPHNLHINITIKSP